MLQHENVITARLVQYEMDAVERLTIEAVRKRAQYMTDGVCATPDTYLEALTHILNFVTGGTA